MQLKLDTHGLETFGLETFVYSEAGWRVKLMVVPFLESMICFGLRQLDSTAFHTVEIVDSCFIIQFGP